MLIPSFITFTGADDRTRIEDLQALHGDFPVEIGVLFSKSRAGSPRYPRAAWIEALRGSGLRLAAHVCGAWASEIASGGRPEIEHLLGPFSRVQVNVGFPADPGVVRAWADGVSDRIGIQIEPILQARGDRFPEDARVAWLFDRSGGRGEMPETWPAPAAPGVRFGYAGGLGPGTVGAALARMPEAPEAWIDMESRVRNLDDAFDLGLCRQVCEIAFESTRSA
jgi:hypothetical protein